MKSEEQQLEATLPGSHYLLDEHFAAERKSIFHKEWFCVGRREGLANRGDYRLVEFHEGMRAELYDLRNDPGEKNNLTESQPALASELREQLDAWRKTVGAQMPTDNPNYQARQ